jgi:co-chaperonin GroES (HSP10)
MKAIGKYIVISELKEDIKKTEGGLLLAENHREDIRYRTAEVVSVGTHVGGIEVGNKIYYDRIAGHNIELETGIFKVIQEIDVIIVL